MACKGLVTVHHKVAERNVCDVAHYSIRVWYRSDRCAVPISKYAILDKHVCRIVLDCNIVIAAAESATLYCDIVGGKQVLLVLFWGVPRLACRCTT